MIHVPLHSITPSGQAGSWPAISRRAMLGNTPAGFGSLALASLLCEEAATAELSTASRASTAPASGPRDPLAAQMPHVSPRARRVIFLFMKGGPSHVDTFDYKPLLERDDGQPLPFEKPRVQFAETTTLMKSPWAFRAYGESRIMVSDLFPHVARHVDDLCILNSLHGTNAAHGGACLKLHTGSDNFVRPSMGSWVTYGLGTENRNLPGFITICPTLSHGGVKNWDSAFLPAAYAGTPLGNASTPIEHATVKYLRNPRLPRETLRRQLDLLGEINQEHLAEFGPDQALEGRINSFELAFRMQAEVPEIEDISSESLATQALYGLDDKTTAPFGRQCLLARRFAERGVRFIQVTHSDSKVQWDQHSKLKEGHEKNALEVDRPIAGLLADLKMRGLLEDTLVLWGGEFGRTPTAQSGDGRDHNPEGFTMWLAGGGVKGGVQYGATDDYGYYAQVDKMHIHDLHATLLHLLGINHERLTYRYAGRDFRLTDVHGHVHEKIFA